EVGDADAKPRFSAGDQWHRRRVPPLQDPAADADHGPRRLRGEGSVADRGRQAHPSRPGCAPYRPRGPDASRRSRAQAGQGDDTGAELAIGSRAAPESRPDVGGAAVKRIDCLKTIYPELEDCAVVTIMGAVAAELYSLGHRGNFFYLEHAMGL